MLSSGISLVPGASRSAVDEIGVCVPLLEGEVEVVREGILLGGEGCAELDDAVDRCCCSVQPELWIGKEVRCDSD
jgi:hypothetical protein